MRENRFLSWLLVIAVLGVVLTYQGRTAELNDGQLAAAEKNLKETEDSRDLPESQEDHGKGNINNSLEDYIEKYWDDQSQQKEIKPSKPEIKAEVAAVYNLTEDNFIFQKQADKQWPLASLTKIMTALVATEKIGLDKDVTISYEAVAVDQIAGDFRPAEVFTVRDILMSIFLVSSNDGAYALAEHYGLDRFMARMNEKADELKMTETKYKEPTGLSAQNVSTGQDLIKLIRYIYQEHPEIIYFSRQPEVMIIDSRFGNEKKYESIIKFAGQRDFLGGKTGYLREAKENLVTIFRNDNNIYVLVIMGSDDRFGETEKLLNWLKEQK